MGLPLWYHWYESGLLFAITVKVAEAPLEQTVWDAGWVVIAGHCALSSELKEIKNKNVQ